MPESRTLIVSGVRTGMGRELARLAAARGRRVFGCASSPVERLAGDAELQALVDAGQLVYVQADVARRADVQALRERMLQAGDMSGSDALEIVANAGIARWGDPGDPQVFAALEQMRRVNVDGTRHLAEVFQPELAAASQASFVAASSIVAARGQAIAGNTQYMATKLEAQYFATGVVPNTPAFAGVRSFAVAPGVVPTPMILDELLLPLIFRTALVEASRDAELAQGLLQLSPPDAPRSTAAERLQGVLRAQLDADPSSFKRLLEALSDDPDLARRGLTSLMRVARQPGPVRERVLEVLYALDLAVTAEFVAERLLDQLDSGETPQKRVLEIYSRSGRDPILRLMRGL